MRSRLSLFFGFFVSLSALHVVQANLSCTIVASSSCSGVIVVRLSDSSNAHGELPSQSTAGYANNVVCCSGPSGLSNACSGTFAVAVKLSSTTNAHMQQNDQVGYSHQTCLSVPSGDVQIGYATDCTTFGYETTLLSISAVDNAHGGTSTAYATKVCGSAASYGPQYISYSLSSNSVGFGPISTALTRYATSNALGSSTEVVAHTLAVTSNSANGYSVTLQGATPTLVSDGVSTINEIGSIATPLSPGQEQFGMRLVSSGGDGAVISPYNTANYAYSGTSSPSLVAQASSGTSATSTFSFYYGANVSNQTVPGTYATQLNFIVTANF